MTSQRDVHTLCYLKPIRNVEGLFTAQVGQAVRFNVHSAHSPSCRGSFVAPQGTTFIATRVRGERGPQYFLEVRNPGRGPEHYRDDVLVVKMNSNPNRNGMFIGHTTVCLVGDSVNIPSKTVFFLYVNRDDLGLQVTRDEN